MTRFKGTPLFGADSNPEHTSEIIGIVGTCFLFVIFLICSFLIKFDQKPKFKEVQIVLASTPVKEKLNSEKKSIEANSLQSSPPVPQKNEIAESVVKPKEPEKESAKPAAAKKTKTSAQPKPLPTSAENNAEPVTYAADPMEAFNSQLSKKKKQDFDWSQLEDDDSSQSKTTAEPSRKVTTQTQTFGEAARTADSSVRAIKSTSETTKKTTTQTSSSTVQSLAGIANTKFSGLATDSVSSESNVKTTRKSSGEVSIQMTDGSTRALFYPKEPVINLSAGAASTIDSSKKVTISFKVDTAGNVSAIEITPESILHQIVRDEIRKQVGQWLFEPANYSASANFEYNIKLK